MKSFAWFIARLAIAFALASVLFAGVLELGLIKTGVILEGSFIDTLLRLIFGLITLSIFVNTDFINWFKAIAGIALYAVFAVIACYLGYLTVILPYMLLKTPN